MTVAEASFQPDEFRRVDAATLGLAKPEPRKIALLGYRSHPFVGGQGIYLKYLSRALAALGHRVDVISGPPYPDLDDNIALIKVPSLDLFARKSHVTALRPRHLISFADTFEWWSMLTGGFAEPYTFGRRIQKHLSTSDYDIVHDNQSLCFGLLNLQRRGMKVVATIHHPIHRDRAIALQATQKWGDRLLVKRWYSFLRMQERVVKALDNVITVSRASQRDIARYFCRASEQTPVIPNGVDTDTFCPLADVPRSRRRILTAVSSDQPLKGLPYLLAAVAKLKERYPDIHLRVIGSLRKGGATEKQLRQLKLTNNVSFASGVSTVQLVNEYARAALVVCPSLYEGFGLPAAEAMSCGAALIVTDGGALPEVVGDAGVVVPAADSGALAAQITTLLEHPERARAMGRSARRHIVENFCWQKVALQLSHYYESIIDRADH